MPHNTDAVHTASMQELSLECNQLTLLSSVIFRQADANMKWVIDHDTFV